MSFGELLNLGKIKVKYNGEELVEFVDYSAYVNVLGEPIFELEKQNIKMDIYDDKKGGGLLTVYRSNRSVCICPFKMNPEGIIIDITGTADNLCTNVIC